MRNQQRRNFHELRRRLIRPSGGGRSRRQGSERGEPANENRAYQNLAASKPECRGRIIAIRVKHGPAPRRLIDRFYLSWMRIRCSRSGANEPHKYCVHNARRQAKPANCLNFSQILRWLSALNSTIPELNCQRRSRMKSLCSLPVRPTEAAHDAGGRLFSGSGRFLQFWLRSGGCYRVAADETALRDVASNLPAALLRHCQPFFLGAPSESALDAPRGREP